MIKVTCPRFPVQVADGLANRGVNHRFIGRIHALLVPLLIILVIFLGFFVVGLLGVVLLFMLSCFVLFFLGGVLVFRCPCPLTMVFLYFLL